MTDLTYLTGGKVSISQPSLPLMIGLSAYQLYLSIYVYIYIYAVQN